MHKAIVLRAWILFLRRDIAGPFLEQVSSRLRGTCSRFSRPHQLLAPASQGPCFPPNHPRTHPAPGPNKCLSFQPSLLLKPRQRPPDVGGASSRSQLESLLPHRASPLAQQHLCQGFFRAHRDANPSHPPAATSLGHTPESALPDACLVSLLPQALVRPRQRQIRPGPFSARHLLLLHYRSSCMPSHVLASGLVHLPHGVCLCLMSEKTSAHCLLSH